MLQSDLEQRAWTWADGRPQRASHPAAALEDQLGSKRRATGMLSVPGAAQN